jgi:hypothetical protein
MIVTRAHKKEFERYMLIKFISHVSHGLRVISIDNCETPDFIVRELNKNINIELTRLILPDLMKIEEFQKKLVNRAWEKFKTKYPDKLQVLIDFSNEVIECSANEVDSYADQILEIVEPLFLTNRKFEFHLKSVGRGRINRFIHSISIGNNLDFDNWQPFGAFMVKQVSPQWVEEIIKSKEGKILQYQEKANENWLLLIANFGHESSTHEFDYLVLDNFQSIFDRIYLYKYMENSYTQIF